MSQRAGAVGCKLLNEDRSRQVSARAFPTLLTYWLSFSGLAHRYPREPLAGMGVEGPDLVAVVRGGEDMPRSGQHGHVAKLRPRRQRARRELRRTQHGKHAQRRQ